MKQHPKKIATHFLTNGTTVAGDNFESVDRVIGSKDEEANCVDAADLDIYGLDRSASTTYDAYVDHNSTVDRDLTLTLIDTLIQNVRDKLDTPQLSNHVFLTGNDTYRVWNQLLAPKQRFGTTPVKISGASIVTDDIVSIPW